MLAVTIKTQNTHRIVELATDIIENQFDAFTKKHYDKLIQKYNVSNEQLKSHSRNRETESKTRFFY
jgi:RNA polymerase sigma-54 factor